MSAGCNKHVRHECACVSSVMRCECGFRVATNPSDGECPWGGDFPSGPMGMMVTA